VARAYRPAGDRARDLAAATATLLSQLADSTVIPVIGFALPGPGPWALVDAAAAVGRQLIDARQATHRAADATRALAARLDPG
jgi:hypothetical protein